MTLKIMEKYSDYVYVLFRVVLGLFIAMHGASKFGLIGDGSVSGFAGAMGLPVWLGFLAAFTELAGGIAIALGVLTRLAALGEVIVMLVAYVMAHAPKGLNPMANGGELAIVFLVAFLFIMTRGGVKCSLEKLIFKKELI